MRKRVIAMVVLVAALASAQSLGDVARENRAAKRKQAARVITNDDVASSAPAEQPAAVAPTNAPTTQQQRRDKITTDLVRETEKQYGEYRKRANDLKVEIAKLQGEAAQVERNRLVQATNFYMDAGQRLRDPKAWTEQRQKLDEDVAKKNKELEAAKQKLEDLREEARKLGIPASVVE